MNLVRPPKMAAQIIIKQHGPMFTMTPPTASMAGLFSGSEHETFRKKVLPNFSAALGQAVALADGFGWEIVDDTGTLTAEQIAAVVAAVELGEKL